MATGNVVLSTDSGDADRVADSCPIVFINTTNIGEGLKRAVIDVEYRKTAARNGRTYVEKRHGHIKVARELIDVLDGIHPADIMHIPLFAEKYFTAPAGLLAAEKDAMLHRFWQRLRLYETDKT
jgi:hypothetical protein